MQQDRNVCPIREPNQFRGHLSTRLYIPYVSRLSRNNNIGVDEHAQSIAPVWGPKRPWAFLV